MALILLAAIPPSGAPLRGAGVPRRAVTAGIAASAGLLGRATPADADPLTDSPLFLLSPFGMFRFAAKQQTEQQQACFEAGECVDRVPYYRLECARDDLDCLQRKRRLASEQFDRFSVDPFSQPLYLVCAFFLLSGPFAAFARFTAALIRELLSKPSDDQK
ncbi:hypothetical protein AB1Y20_005332 [Prymnesium parvum]|uniref:PSI-J n=1 Tax=Prymnesium parvum TaxID=97485 RepID=A0AB34J403_PRYPA